MKAGVGFSCDVDQQLMKDANIKEEKDRFVALVWDEMKNTHVTWLDLPILVKSMMNWIK